MSPNSSLPRFDNRGTTIAETMVILAITAIVILAAASFLAYSSSSVQSVDVATQAQSDKSRFRDEIQFSVEASIEGTLWLNQQIAQAIFVPWTQGGALVSSSAGSIEVLPNTFVDSTGATSPDGTGNFDAFVWIQGRAGVSPITFDTSSGPDPGYIIGAGQTSQQFNLIGTPDLTAYTAGTVVGVETLMGTQFAKVTAAGGNSITLDWSQFGQFNIATQIQNWPVQYLTSGVSLFPIQVQILAASSPTSGFNLWRVDPISGQYLLQDSLIYTPVSIKAFGIGTPVPLTNFLVLHQSPFEILVTLTVQSGLVVNYLKFEQPL